MRSITATLAVALVALAATDAFAQDAIRKIDPAKPIGAIDVTQAAPRGAAVLSPQENDALIVRWLSVDNRGVVDCAKLAADHSKSDAVKQFAADVAKHHEEFQNGFGKQQAQTNADAAQPQNDPTKTATLLRDDGSSRAGAMIYRPTDFVAVKEEVCNSLKDFGKKQLTAIEGDHFDRVFLAHMSFAHHMLIASVDALDDTASADLKPQLKQLRDMLEQHLAQLGELEKNVHIDATAARPGSSEVK